MTNKNQLSYLVCVECMTFNHARYIEETLNGFTMQQTDFPFVCIIVDDASNDGEPDIINKYLVEHFVLEGQGVRNDETDDFNMIFARHKINENCFFAVYFLKYNHYSIQKSKETYFVEFTNNEKYHAICEGDDYWTDPNKLQMQVSFLESHLDYGMCYTKAYFGENGVIGGIHGTSDTSFAGLIKYSNFPTLTRVYRKSIYDNYIKEIHPEEKSWLMGDYPMAFYFVVKSKVGYIDKFTAVYRIVPESASHSNNLDYLFRFYDSADNVRRFFVDMYVHDEIMKSDYHAQIKRMEVKYKISQYLMFKKREDARILYLSRRDDLSKYSQVLYDIRTRSLFLNRGVNFFISLLCKFENLFMR